ncbi:3230_t:CDS:2, partial [Dentiscutata erythropus]
LGALLVKTELAPIFKKQYFGGGTEKLASVKGIHVRIGGFCNPSCLSRWVNVNLDQVMANYKTRKLCGDDYDIHDSKPTGSLWVLCQLLMTF